MSITSYSIFYASSSPALSFQYSQIGGYKKQNKTPLNQTSKKPKIKPPKITTLGHLFSRLKQKAFLSLYSYVMFHPTTISVAPFLESLQCVNVLLVLSASDNPRRKIVQQRGRLASLSLSATFLLTLLRRRLIFFTARIHFRLKLSLVLTGTTGPCLQTCFYLVRPSLYLCVELFLTDIELH